MDFLAGTGGALGLGLRVLVLLGFDCAVVTDG